MTVNIYSKVCFSHISIFYSSHMAQAFARPALCLVHEPSKIQTYTEPWPPQWRPLMDLMNYQAIFCFTAATYSGTFSKYRFWMARILHSLALTDFLTAPPAVPASFHIDIFSFKFPFPFSLTPCSRLWWLWGSHAHTFSTSLFSWYDRLSFLQNWGSWFSANRHHLLPFWAASRGRRWHAERQVVTSPAVRHGTNSYSFSLFWCFCGPPSQFHWVPCRRCSNFSFFVIHLLSFLFCFSILLLVCCCWCAVCHELISLRKKTQTYSVLFYSTPGCMCVYLK